MVNRIKIRHVSQFPGKFGAVITVNVQNFLEQYTGFSIFMNYPNHTNITGRCHDLACFSSVDNICITFPNSRWGWNDPAVLLMDSAGQDLGKRDSASFVAESVVSNG